MPRPRKVTVARSAKKLSAKQPKKLTTKQAAKRLTAKEPAKKSSTKKPVKNLKAEQPTQRLTTRLSGKTAAVRQPNRNSKQPTSSTQKRPGEILLDSFMKPFGLNANRLALLLHVPPQRIGAILHGHRGISPETSLRLARLFGTTARFWLDLESDFALSEADVKWSRILVKEINPIGDKKLVTVKKFMSIASPSTLKGAKKSLDDFEGFDG